MNSSAVQADGLVKRYGSTVALAGLDLAVPAGTVLGLLGPNGAGKTTAVRILATLVQPDGGSARVGGFDVTREPGKVRELIGLTGQYATVDDALTGRENLILIGRLLELSRTRARDRAGELLERFDLAAAAGRLVRTYSGGMRRRLDVAASLIGRPRILFLDEPTTGLDPRARGDVWDLVRGLVNDGTTVLLTTQYLDEADRLASQVAIIDAGRVIESGPPAQLKNKLGGQVLGVRPVDPSRVDDTVRIIAELVPNVVKASDDGLVSTPVPAADGTWTLVAVAGRMSAAGIEVSELGLRLASLDEVFLALTGKAVAGVDA
jgi:oleandomycin transport system ATP-binding protein